MHRIGPTLYRLLGSAALALLLAGACFADAAPPVLLWPDGAPGSEGRSGPETVRLTERGEHIVSGVHAPSLTVRLPSAQAATGAAVIVIPGGGHRELWMDHEGYRVADAFVEHGIAAFVLKYRLAREEGSPYTIEGHALADVQRAIRLVRSRASEWRVDPTRVGVIGFSAGGELAALAGARFGAVVPRDSDPIDRLSSRPSFQGLIYPSIPAGLVVPRDAPPAFLLCGAADQPAISRGLASLYLDFTAAGVPSELHIYAGVGHGFGIRPSEHGPAAAWPSRFVEWLDAQGLLRSR
jgi:endo-1,4-beta-xylanase